MNVYINHYEVHIYIVQGSIESIYRLVFYRINRVSPEDIS